MSKIATNPCSCGFGFPSISNTNKGSRIFCRSCKREVEKGSMPAATKAWNDGVAKAERAKAAKAEPTPGPTIGRRIKSLKVLGTHDTVELSIGINGDAVANFLHHPQVRVKLADKPATLAEKNARMDLALKLAEIVDNKPPAPGDTSWRWWADRISQLFETVRLS